MKFGKLFFLTCGLFALCFAATGAKAEEAQYGSAPDSTLESFQITQAAGCTCQCPGFPQSYSYAEAGSYGQACANARANMPMDCVPIYCR